MWIYRRWSALKHQHQAMHGNNGGAADLGEEHLHRQVNVGVPL